MFSYNNRPTRQIYYVRKRRFQQENAKVRYVLPDRPYYKLTAKGNKYYLTSDLFHKLLNSGVKGIYYTGTCLQIV